MARRQPPPVPPDDEGSIPSDLPDIDALLGLPQAEPQPPAGESVEALLAQAPELAVTAIVLMTLECEIPGTDDTETVYATYRVDATTAWTRDMILADARAQREAQNSTKTNKTNCVEVDIEIEAPLFFEHPSGI